MSEKQGGRMDWKRMREVLKDKEQWEKTGEFELLCEALYTFGEKAGNIALGAKSDNPSKKELYDLLKSKLEEVCSELLNTAKDRVLVPAGWDECQRALRDCGIFDELRIVAQIMDSVDNNGKESTAIDTANVAINSIKDAIRKVFGWLHFPFKKLIDLLLDIIDEILDLLRILVPAT